MLESYESFIDIYTCWDHVLNIVSTSDSVVVFHKYWENQLKQTKKCIY